MSDYGYGDYMAYKMKMNAIAFVVMIFGAILYFGGTAIYEVVNGFMVSITDIDWLILGVSVSVTAWAVIGFLWGVYVVYKDGK